VRPHHERYQYLVLRLALFLFFGFVTLPVPIAAFWLIDYLDAHEQVRMLRWLLLPVVLAWLFGLPWLTSHTSQHIAFEDQKLGAAVRLTLNELRLNLAFLPLVGHWFEPPTDKSDSDSDDT